ncbi:MAG: M48 family metalloprotease [Armatimonadetes bacterium]|nr:M48 family metalloprotease [Armatimonadota bacterium]
MYRARSVFKWLTCVTTLIIVLATTCESSLQEDEEKLGRDYAAEIEKRVKLVSGEQAERVARIGKDLAEIARNIEVPARYGSSEVSKFNYEFKVIEDKDVNAFSLPGGRIYVNSGLLDLITSDDELAGVLAHEIAHAAHHHMIALLRKQSNVDKYVALVAIAGILSNMRGRDLNNILMGAQMIRIGKLNTYTQEAEKDADRTAVAYMVRSKYNPEGLLSFMRKLEEKHQENPTLPLGIYQTHPAPYRRVAFIAQAMQEEGIKVNMREMTDMACARSVPADDEGNAYRVVINKKVIFEPAPLNSGVSSKDRSDQIAKRINEALDAKITSRDIRSDPTGTALLARDTEIIRIEPEDAPNPDAARALLHKARAALEYAIWADWLCNRCTNPQEPKPKE